MAFWPSLIFFTCFPRLCLHHRLMYFAYFSFLLFLINTCFLFFFTIFFSYSFFPSKTIHLSFSLSLSRHTLLFRTWHPTIIYHLHSSWPPSKHIVSYLHTDELLVQPKHQSQSCSFLFSCKSTQLAEPIPYLSLIFLAS